MLATIAAAYLAAIVECVEALTIVLAAGAAAGWKPALGGAATGLGLLAVLVAGASPWLGRIPPLAANLATALLLLPLGAHWLRKGLRRAAGKVALRNEDDVYRRTLASQTARPAAFAASLQMVLTEGIEVVLIVLALAAAHPARLLPAAAGATLAAATVVALGATLHRPLTRVPENTLKLAASVVLIAVGTAALVRVVIL